MATQELQQPSINLYDEQPVDKNKGGRLQKGTYSVNGKEYVRAISLAIGCASLTDGELWVEYDLGRHYSKFTAEVGLSDLDSSSSRGSFSVMGDGRSLLTGSTRLGTSKSVSVNVQNVLRLRLYATNPKGSIACHMNEDISTHTVWGNATIS